MRGWEVDKKQKATTKQTNKQTRPADLSFWDRKTTPSDSFSSCCPFGARSSSWHSGAWGVLGSDVLSPPASNAIMSCYLDGSHPCWLDAYFLSFCPVSPLPLAALRRLVHHVRQVGQPSPWANPVPNDLLTFTSFLSPRTKCLLVLELSIPRNGRNGADKVSPS